MAAVHFVGQQFQMNVPARDLTTAEAAADGTSATLIATGLYTTLSVPSAPTALAATNVSHQASLTWTAPASSVVASYNILRSATTGTETLLVSGITTTSYIDTTVVPGAYFYTVQAVNAAGASASSTEATVTIS